MVQIPPAQLRARQHNTPRIHLSRIKGNAAVQKPKTPYEAWSLLINENNENILNNTEISMAYDKTAIFVEHLSYT